MTAHRLVLKLYTIETIEDAEYLIQQINKQDEQSPVQRAFRSFNADYSKLWWVFIIPINIAFVWAGAELKTEAAIFVSLVISAIIAFIVGNIVSSGFEDFKLKRSIPILEAFSAKNQKPNKDKY